ncbi:MAG: carbohydrate kinase family protein [Spirochaetaceae bacterium]
MIRKLKINATGCCLVDKIITGVDFSSTEIKPYLSQIKGDGGLSPGELVFRENLEKYSGVSLGHILSDIGLDNFKEELNVGGPAIVALISMAQILHKKSVIFNFFQNHGDDENGLYLLKKLNEFAPSINTEFYNEVTGITAETTVLSDPNYNSHGERTFINTIGCAGDYRSIYLGDDFFDGDILIYGATALTPGIHNDLSSLLDRGFRAGKINIVTTVFDFFNEEKSPVDRWPLGNTTDSYSHIDLLITDHVEALRLSGKSCIADAIKQFKTWKLKALIITNGAEDVTYYAEENSKIFKDVNTESLPVLNINCQEILSMDLISGDTTGCGDNFAGGVISSITEQLLEDRNKLDLKEAVIIGSCTGASTCFSLGGMLSEESPGEKLQLVERFREIYEVTV